MNTEKLTKEELQVLKKIIQKMTDPVEEKQEVPVTKDQKPSIFFSQKVPRSNILDQLRKDVVQESKKTIKGRTCNGAWSSPGNRQPKIWIIRYKDKFNPKAASNKARHCNTRKEAQEAVLEFDRIWFERYTLARKRSSRRKDE